MASAAPEHTPTIGPVDLIGRVQACCTVDGATVLDEGAAVELAEVLKALADPVRLRLVSIIASAPAGEVCACDLPGSVGRSQPTVSHHLSQLVTAGILEREQRGRWAWFRLHRSAIATVVAAVESCCGAEAQPQHRSR